MNVGPELRRLRVEAAAPIKSSFQALLLDCGLFICLSHVPSLPPHIRRASSYISSAIVRDILFWRWLPIFY
jgi:hypothetical protein